jgi:hypothetical protein
MPRFATFYPPSDLAILRHNGFDTIQGSTGWGWVAWIENRQKPFMIVKLLKDRGCSWEGLEDWGKKFVHNPLDFVPAEAAALAHPHGQLVWLPINIADCHLRTSPCKRCTFFGINCLVESTEFLDCWPCSAINKTCLTAAPIDGQGVRASRMYPARDQTTMKFIHGRFLQAWERCLTKYGLYVNQCGVRVY